MSGVEASFHRGGRDVRVEALVIDEELDGLVSGQQGWRRSAGAAWRRSGVLQTATVFPRKVGQLTLVDAVVAVVAVVVGAVVVGGVVVVAIFENGVVVIVGVTGRQQAAGGKQNDQAHRQSATWLKNSLQNFIHTRQADDRRRFRTG